MEKGKNFGYSATVLKLIALVTMTIDHIGYLFFPYEQIFRIIGRIAFPVFAYMIAEGCRYTKHKLRYFLMVSGVGLICSVVYYFFDDSLFQSVLTSFSLAIATIYGIDFLKKGIAFQGDKRKKATKIIIGALWVAAMLALDVVLGLPIKELENVGFYIDYKLWGILLPVIVYVVPDNKWLKLLALSVGLVPLALTGMSVQWYSYLALPVIALYSGKKGKYSLKYLFYLYYPLHLALLYAISMLI